MNGATCRDWQPTTIPPVRGSAQDVAGLNQQLCNVTKQFNVGQHIRGQDKNAPTCLGRVLLVMLPGPAWERSVAAKPRPAKTAASGGAACAGACPRIWPGGRSVRCRSAPGCGGGYHGLMICASSFLSASRMYVLRCCPGSPHAGGRRRRTRLRRTGRCGDGLGHPEPLRLPVPQPNPARQLRQPAFRSRGPQCRQTRP